MKLKFLLLVAVSAVSFQSFAQTWLADSVSVGAVPPGPPGPTTYPLDVYYSMKNGKVHEDSNFKWHLAFDMIPASGPSSYAGIIANHVQGKVNVYSAHKAGSAFASFGAADTVGITGHPLYNTDTNWHWGAFNANRGTNPFDFGWGIYDQVSHNLFGDSIYVVKVNTTAYKVWIQDLVSNPLDSIHYTFRIAMLDGTNDNTVKIYRKKGTDYTRRNFAYYNITNNAETNHEPDNTSWDIVFTRFIEPIAMGPGPKQPYPVAGVLSNLKVQVAEARKMDADTVKLANQTLTKYTSEIGSDWKRFDMTNPPGAWVLDTVSYFVKSFNSQEFYQIKFTRFDGSGTGKYVFAKRMIQATSVKDITSNVSSYAIAPNPAVNDANLVLDAKEAGDAQLLVTDLTGKVMQHSLVNLTKGTNAFSIPTGSYPAGMYIVTLTNGSWKIADKLVVQH